MSTVRIIARHTGFSIATISRAINEPNKVSVETLAVVRNAMQELNYEKKEKIKKKSNIFGVIFPNISNPFFSELLGVLENEAFHNGRCILFFNSRHNLHQEKIALAECKSHGVDGVFLVPHSTSPEYLQTIKNLPFPTVLLTQTSPCLPSVGVDHIEGGRLVADHFFSSGHNKIGYIGPISKQEGKYIGFINRLNELGINISEEFQFNAVEGTFLKGFINSCIDENQNLKISALFCMNDMVAQKVIEILTEFGFVIPKDLVVVGLDNTFTSRILRITSVSQPMQEIAHVGFQEMLDLIKENKKSENYSAQLLLPRLVLRESSLQLKRK